VRGSSGGRVDEVRERERGVVYTRRLTAPRSRPSKRLAQISKGRVVELELHRDRLAQIVRRARRGEVRLIDISERSTRRLFAVGIGQLGAQYLAGIGFADGRLCGRWTARDAFALASIATDCRPVSFHVPDFRV